MRRIISFLFLACSVALMAQQVPPVPADPDVRVGHLDNGLTYYIQHNNWPEKRASFYIAQRVGSVQEEESQRGLAHFLEHMAFNGSKNFPGDMLINWCQQKGVAFGRELNAYTSTDRTVYNIDNVSTELGEAVLDSFLLILHDWADGLTLDGEEIDKERGVIHEEWRSRSSASQRILERQLPKLYPGSKYGVRMPIGLMSVVDNFNYKELRDYYEKWYNPENQAIVVVGDIDVDHIEAKIKELFSGIKSAEGAGVVMDEAVPDTGDPIIVVDKDKEQRSPVLMFVLKHDVLPRDLRSTMIGMFQDYLCEGVSWMMRQRLNELQQKADCPYSQAGAEDGNSFLLTHTKGGFLFYAIPKSSEQTAATLQVLVQEMRRMSEHGFTAGEYERFKADYFAALKNAVDNKDKRRSSELARNYCENYLQNQPMPSVDVEASMMRQIGEMVPLEKVNEFVKQSYAKLDSNLVVLSMQPDKEGMTIPTEEELQAALNAGKVASVQAYEEKVNDQPLLAKKPKAGKIVSKKKLADLEATELVFKNGVKVILKHTDFKADEVKITAYADGGTGLYGLDDYANLQMYEQVVNESGLGTYSRMDLNKFLAGKTVSLKLDMDETHATINGWCAPGDMETQLQLIYLSMTQLAKDEDSYQSVLSMVRTNLANAVEMPEYALHDSVNAVISGNNPRNRNMRPEDLNKVSYDRIMEIARQQTQDGGNYTFFVVGNYDESTIKTLLAQYLGALPAAKKVLQPKNQTTFAKSSVVNKFQHKMETPQVTSYLLLRNTQMEVNEQNEALAAVAGGLLQKNYTQVIREENGAAYSPYGAGSAREDNETHVIRLTGFCQMNPDKADLALRLMREGLNNLANEVNVVKLASTKDNLLKVYQQGMKTNKAWIDCLERLEKGLGDDRKYGDALKQITPDMVKQFVKQMLESGQLLEITMYPEE